MKTKSNNQLYALMTWMGVVPILSSAAITVLAINYESIILNFELWAWIIFYFVTVLSMALAITPTTFISLISGYFLGFLGLVPLIISYQFASLIGYSLAKKFDGSFVELIKNRYPRSNQIFENVNQNQFVLVLLSRLSPALPFAIMNVVLSISKIRANNFFWGGLIGMLPRTIFFIWIGMQASRLNEALDNSGNVYLSIAISLVVIYIIYRIVKGKMK